MVVPAKRSNPFNPRTSKASDATYHEPVPPNLASHGQKFGNKVRIPTYKAMQNGPDPKRSLELLMRIASLVKPIMVKHNFFVGSLHEFYPSQQNLLGINVNAGFKIMIRLRYPHAPDAYMPEEALIETMLHELAHNLFGLHDEKFFGFLKKITEELDNYRYMGKWDGEGFLTEGKKLGGNGGRGEDRDRMLRNIENRMKKQKLGLEGGKGGRVLSEGEDVNKVLGKKLGGTKASGKNEAEKRAEAIAKRLPHSPSKTPTTSKFSKPPSSKPLISSTCCVSSQLQQEKAEEELEEEERINGIVVIRIEDDDEQEDEIGNDRDQVQYPKGQEWEAKQELVEEEGDRRNEKGEPQTKSKNGSTEVRKGRGKVQVINLDTSDEESEEESKKPLNSNLSRNGNQGSDPIPNSKPLPPPIEPIQISDSDSSQTEDEDEAVTISKGGSSKSRKALELPSQQVKAQDKGAKSSLPSTSKPTPNLKRPKFSTTNYSKSCLLTPSIPASSNIESSKSMKALEKKRREGTAEKIWKLKIDADRKDKQMKEKGTNGGRLGGGAASGGHPFAGGNNNDLSNSSHQLPAYLPAHHANHQAFYPSNPNSAFTLSTFGSGNETRNLSEWTCQSCTFVNGPQGNRCFVCQNARTGIHVEDLVMTGDQEVLKIQESGKGKGKGRVIDSDVNARNDGESSRRIGTSKSHDGGNGWQCLNCLAVMTDAAAEFWCCQSCGNVKSKS